ATPGLGTQKEAPARPLHRGGVGPGPRLLGGREELLAHRSSGPGPRRVAVRARRPDILESVCPSRRDRGGVMVELLEGGGLAVPALIAIEPDHVCPSEALDGGL